MLLCVMFSNRSQSTKKCGKNKVSGTRATDKCVTDVLTSFLIYKAEQTHGNIFFLQLFRERLSEKLCPQQARKVIWDMINTLFLTTVVVENTFVAFL